MQVKPNRTVVLGQVVAVRPQPDGWGAEVDVKVHANESPDRDEDFLRPEAGSTLTVFTAQPEGLEEGAHLRAEVHLNAGPTGGRAVMRSFQPAPADGAKPQDKGGPEPPKPKGQGPVTP